MTNLRVFGSVARGQDRPDSDVDLLADLPPGMGLLGLGRVQAELEDILGTRVDLIAGTLKPEVPALAPTVTWPRCDLPGAPAAPRNGRSERIGWEQVRRPVQLPVLTMITGYARWLSAVLAAGGSPAGLRGYPRTGRLHSSAIGAIMEP